MSKYEERVSSLAMDFMSIYIYGKSGKIKKEQFNKASFKTIKTNMVAIARLSVQREAEAYIECFHYGMSEDTRIILNNALQSRLLDCGLIPAQTQTT